MPRMKRAGLAILLFVVTLLGCQGPPPPQPVDITYGADICGSCDEIIKERRFATEYINTHR